MIMKSSHFFASDLKYLAAKSEILLYHSRLTLYLPQTLSHNLLQKMEPKQHCMVYKDC